MTCDSNNLCRGGLLALSLCGQRHGLTHGNYTNCPTLLVLLLMHQKPVMRDMRQGPNKQGWSMTRNKHQFSPALQQGSLTIRHVCVGAPAP